MQQIFRTNIRLNPDYFILQVLEVLNQRNLKCGAPVEIADKAELCRCFYFMSLKLL